MQLSKSSPAIHGGWWLNFQLMHVVTLADDDTNSILFMTEVSVKSRRMAVTSNCVNEKEFFYRTHVHMGSDHWVALSVCPSTFG